MAQSSLHSSPTGQAPGETSNWRRHHPSIFSAKPVVGDFRHVGNIQESSQFFPFDSCSRGCVPPAPEERRERLAVGDFKYAFFRLREGMVDLFIRSIKTMEHPCEGLKFRRHQVRNEYSRPVRGPRQRSVRGTQWSSCSQNPFKGALVFRCLHKWLRDRCPVYHPSRLYNLKIVLLVFAILFWSVIL